LAFYYSLALFEGNSLDGLTYLLSVSRTDPVDEFDFVQGNLVWNLSPNTTYTFVVGGLNCTPCINEGTFCVEIGRTPVNEECTTATQITLAPDACVTGSNYYASDADPQPSCNPHPGASVWYEISAPASGMIQMETFPNFSEVITVYEGTCGSLNEILCSVNGDDTDNGLVCNDNYITISTNFTCPTANTSCDDNNPNTIHDVWDGNCNCEGTCANNVGDICDDGDDSTPYDFWDANCNCQAQCLRTPADCPNNNYEVNEDTQCKCKCPETVGEGCDDSDPNYVWNDSCECVQNAQGGADYCPPDMIITAEDIGNYTYFQTSDYIETDGSVIVEAAEDLTLNAKNYVKLKPGFNAKAASTMRAYIEGCEPTVQKAGELATASVKHYPNPFRDEFALEFELDSDVDITLTITDVNGRNIKQMKIDNLARGIQTHNISTQSWIPGIYFYQALIKEQQTGILKQANGTLVKM